MADAAPPQTVGTIDETQFDHQFIEVAQKCPGAFVTQVFDFVLKVAEQNAVREGTPPYRDEVWAYRSYGDVYSIKATILRSLEVALGQLASSAAEQFLAYAERLRNSDTETAQYLLIRAYTQNGQRFAGDATTYLCENPERLYTGWMDSGYWATRLLLEAITPYCSQILLSQLEDVIMNYYSDYERGKDSYRKGYGTGFGYSQLVLLNGITSLRRSQVAERRLKEWQRKFLRQDGDAAQGISGGFVGSPLPEKARNSMTDSQWLSAIRKHNGFETRLEGRRIVGGAHQLAHQLETRTKQEPARFARLLLQFPATTTTVYFDAVLSGLGETNEDIEIVLQACRYCHSLPNRPCGRSIGILVPKLGQQRIPNEILEILAWYATEGEDPFGENTKDKTNLAKSELEFRGMNSVRGSTILAVASLIFDDSTRSDYFVPAIKKMVVDPSPSVR